MPQNVSNYSVWQEVKKAANRCFRVLRTPSGKPQRATSSALAVCACRASGWARLGQRVFVFGCVYCFCFILFVSLKKLVSVLFILFLEQGGSASYVLQSYLYFISFTLTKYFEFFFSRRVSNGEIDEYIIEIQYHANKNKLYCKYSEALVFELCILGRNSTLFQEIIHIVLWNLILDADVKYAYLLPNLNHYS